MSWKKFALVWSEILRQFVNTLTADMCTSIPVAMCTISRNKFKQKGEYPSLIISEIMDKEVVTYFRLSQKQRTFCRFFIAFLKCAWNLEHFEKKGEYPSLIISEIMDCERGGYLNV